MPQGWTPIEEPKVPSAAPSGWTPVEEPPARTWGDTAIDLAQGVKSGALSTVFGGGDLIRRGLGMERVIQTPEVQAAITPPASAPGKTGFFVEQLGEFLVPWTKAAKAPQGARLAQRALTAGRNVLTQAGEFGAKTAIQTGGDAEDVIAGALLGAATPPLAATFRMAGKVFTKALPEKLYGQVFKLADDDFRLAMQAQARGATPNPTLAKEVLEKGLFGSSRNMATYSIAKLDDLERQVQALVRQPGPGGTVIRPKITLPQKQDFTKLLGMIEKEFGKGFFSERAAEAGRLRVSFLRIKGNDVLAEDALKVKRFLDKMRNTSSFRLDPKLAPKQDELKAAANLVRSTLKQDPKFATLMNDERIFIEAVDEIVSDAVRRSNKALLNLTDILIGGGGLAGGFPGTGLGAMAAVRAFQRPSVLTSAGQGLFRMGEKLPPAGASARTITGAGAASR